MLYLNVNQMYQSGEYVDKFQETLDSERFMLSASDNLKIAWIRRPFLNYEELNKFLKDFVEQYPRYSNIEIYNEKTLDEQIKVQSKDGGWIELTLRNLIFGERYQSYADQAMNPDDKCPMTEFMIQSNIH